MLRYLTCFSALLVALATNARAEEEPKPQRLTKLTNPLAVRIMNYGKFQDAAWTHLPSVGVHFLFLAVPKPDEVEGLKKKLADHDLAALVLRGDTDLGRDTSVDELAAQLETCGKMGVKYMFLSPKHTGVGKEVACERLRRAGDIARKYDVTIVLETHPDLGTNGDVHGETMKRINHPNVRVNFDTGNITFYNTGLDAGDGVEEVHRLRGHGGGERPRRQAPVVEFPRPGHGRGRFSRGAAGFWRSTTSRGRSPSRSKASTASRWIEAQTKKYIGDSAAYIKSLGNFR